MYLQSLSFSKDKRIQSIVSEGCLTIKALSLSAGESLKKHKTANILYLQCLQGNPNITIFGTSQTEQDETITLSPGTLLRIEANQLHEVEAGEENTLLLLHLVSSK